MGRYVPYFIVYPVKPLAFLLVGPDDCDYNWHLSNSSYPKVCHIGSHLPEISRGGAVQLPRANLTSNVM